MKFSRFVLPLMFVSGLICTVQTVNAAAGKFDSTFGSGGVVSINFNSQFLPADIIEQPDGKIVVSNGYFPFQVARFEPNGSLDTTFGSSGVTNPFAPNNNPSSAGAMALQSNGQILGGRVWRRNRTAEFRRQPG